jgi:signal peptidase I
MNEFEPETEQYSGNPEPKKRSLGKIWRLIIEFVIILAVAFGVTHLVRTFVIQSYKVPSASMEPTIMIGDSFFADRIFYNIGGLTRGDIICFNDKTQEGRILVKRVIAFGGQTIDLQNGHVVVDGTILFEPYTYGQMTEPLNTQFNNIKISYPYVVPEGCLWVMGDNRENSADSRYFGVVKEEDVLGRALFVFWPFEDIGML